MVCNIAVLASAIFKLSKTRPDGTIYSASGRRVGAARPSQSVIMFASARTGGSANEQERSRSIALSKLEVTVDLELGSMSTMSVARTKSSSPPPTMTGTFDGQQVDSGV
jgi:hypothetical protein